MEAVDLLDVRKVIVGHGSVIAGRGWFLDRIVVRLHDVPQCSTRFVFPCHRCATHARAFNGPFSGTGLPG